MPRYASHQLQWSEQAQTYIFTIDGRVGEQPLNAAWLEQITSFAFHSRSGLHYTVRKQKVQRGGDYWYAYRRQGGRIVKRYLGRATDLTFAHLEEVACLLDPSSKRDETLSLPPLPDERAENIARPTPIMNLELEPPLLLSKLAPPRLPALRLDRPRLLGLLDAAQERRLTLVSAPAGFGKTTLVCQWLATRRASLSEGMAWLSLEAADNDPTRFWRYLVAACQVFQLDLTQAHSALAAANPQPPFLPASLEGVLTALLNAFTQAPSGGVLVLEDYHVITEEAIHETLAFFLEHLPPAFHLIIITRNDPPIALARLRARDELYEVRASDLRFSPDETSGLLRQVLPFTPTPETVQRLHERLEGWGAGLHLARLTLQRSTTPAEGEQALERFVQRPASFEEYFVAEVLALQPEPVQRFLLQTSPLARLTASLCDALTGQQDARDMLTLLEQANLFLEPLDASGQWYRYHALFAEAMRAEARRRFGDARLRDLAARASRWYEAHDYPAEAIDAALMAHDDERAAIFIERSIEARAIPGEIQEPHTLLRWFEQLPEATLARHPALCLSYATTLLFRSVSWQPDASTLHAIEKLLQHAEQGFRIANQSRKLGELLAFRALLALRQGAVSSTLTHARQALDCLPPAPAEAEETPNIWRGLSLSIVAEEWIQAGLFSQARAALREAYTHCEAVGNAYFKRVAMMKLARVYFEQGAFQQATTLYRQALAEAREDEHPYVICDTLTGLASLSYERDELESAAQHAQEAIAVSQSSHMLFYEAYATIILARVQAAQGEAVVAQQRLAALLDKIPASLPHLARQVQTAQARLALSTDDHMTVQVWAAARTPQPDFSREIEAELLLARWLRIQDKLEEAASQLERLLATTRKAEHTRCVLEVQIEIALIAAARKHKTEAHRLLRDVLERALVCHATRLFLDAGEPMASLLRSLLPQLRDQASQAYTRSLLSAFPAPQSQDPHAQPSLLLEPLSPQEMRVLRLLVQHRSNAEIANELVVSVNTVRTQVQSIYRKLGVNKRSAASDVARELRLIS